MSGNGRGTMRPQGRTPPFLLIGLLVVLCILGFSYWNVSSKSSERASVIARLQEELQSLSSRKLEADKRSSETNTKLDEVVKMKASLETRLQTLEKENDDFRNQVDSRGNEVQSIQNELETKKDSLKKCEEDSNGIQQELQKLKEEVDALRQDAANKPAQCDLNACSDPVQTVFNVLINTLGRPQVENSLRNNPEYTKFISAGEAANPKAPDAIVNPVNPEQPVVNQVNQQGQAQAAVNQLPPVNQQEQGVPAVNQQQAQAPVDQQGQVNPPVNAGDQGAIGQVQPPQDLQKAVGGEEQNKANKDTGLNPGSDINSNLDVAHEADVHIENDRLLQTLNENKLENTGNVINQDTTDMPEYQRDGKNDPLLQVQHDQPLQHVDYDGNMFANADIAAVRHDDIIDKASDYNTEDDNEKPEDKDAWPQVNQPKAHEGAPAAAMFPAVPLDSPDNIEGDGLEEENGGEDEEGEEEGGDLKFKPQMPPNEVGKDNDAIDRMNNVEQHHIEEYGGNGI